MANPHLHENEERGAYLSASDVAAEVMTDLREGDFLEGDTYVKSAHSGYPSTAAALERAKKEDLKVVYPSSSELQLDIDSEGDYLIWQSLRGILDQYLGVLKVVETPSLSREKGHMHVTVTLNKTLNNFERIAFQAVMGSDRKRELLGLIMQKYAHIHQPTLFLEKK